MGEKQTLKVSLSSVISVFIIAILVIALGIMYYFGFIKNREEINELKTQNGDLKAQVADLSGKINNSSQANSSNETQQTKEKEIIKDDLMATSGYSFNITVEELQKELMKNIEGTNLEKTIEVKQCKDETGPDTIEWLAIGWFNSEDTNDVTGLKIYSNNEKYVSSIVCIPAKYGSGDVGALTVPNNLYDVAKRTLGSETAKWKELERSGKISEKTYDVFTGNEVKSTSDTVNVGERRVLSLSK